VCDTRHGIETELGVSDCWNVLLGDRERPVKRKHMSEDEARYLGLELSSG
jgi:hypothetical protein